ncbi:MAG TPA: 3-deoxy-7-phosphoheptulonate synthase [Bacteroidales bacterium]|nr:3-deoxy-7-phosphoheptulonate synthase [Bacteroidales bacterium]
MEMNHYNDPSIIDGCTVPERVSSRSRIAPSTVTAGGISFGPDGIVIIAGPCAVESREQLLVTAEAVKRSGGMMLRGGAFKPRTSPYKFQGLGEEGIRLLEEAREKTGLPIVTEVMDTRQVEFVSQHADMLQVGSRNMQNYTLLKEVGMQKKPVLLKRGMMATIEEFLMAAEYILNQGNEQVVLCERGIRTFETTTRNTLDISAVPVLKNLCHLPVIVDPSHGTGHRWMVPSMAKAAIAAGADGLILEVHHKPEEALCDGHQSIDPDELTGLMSDIRKIALAVGRYIVETKTKA